MGVERVVCSPMTGKRGRGARRRKEAWKDGGMEEKDEGMEGGGEEEEKGGEKEGFLDG